MGHLFTAFGEDRGPQVVEFVTGARTVTDDLQWKSLPLPYAEAKDLIEDILRRSQSDTAAWNRLQRLIFERGDGRKTTFSDQAAFGGSAGTQIKIKVQPPCEKGQTIYGEYSGKPSPCDYVEFTPGVYKVYAMSWGKQSNIATFTVTQ